MQPSATTARRAAVSSQFTEDTAGSVISNDEGKLLVTVLLNGRKSLAEVTASARKAGLTLVADDADYRHGVIEGFLHLADVTRVARLPGVQAVHLVPAPETNVGATTSQGVALHRVDRIPWTGQGIKVGVLSDSYNTSTNPVRAPNDIATGDLPGPGNPFGRTTPVAVLDDFPAGSDEGRAMLQIVHDMAPDAALAFATANRGQVSFANNIRALADAGCDVIVDDVIYFVEPFFSDGIIAQAVDDVVAEGVSYFSSAGNRPATQGYLSTVRLVTPPQPGQTLAGTNITLPPASVLDPSVYAGGIHNFATSGTDLAQTIAINTSGTISFQWDDPYDVAAPTLGAVLFQAKGALTAATPTRDFIFTSPGDQRVAIFVDADPAVQPPLGDAIVDVFTPDGRLLVSQDTGTVPEEVVLFLSAPGPYTIRVRGFEGSIGAFTVEVRAAQTNSPPVTSNYNLLFFTAGGAFIGAAQEDNIANARPVETFGLNGTGNIQLVVTRANTPPSVPTPASRIRYVWFTSGQPLEYFSYQTPVTFGHNSARGANGVAAYAFFPPYVPESFTSPGPVTIYFDRENRRLAAPEIRLKPDMAAMDGANTTFFTSDVPQDPDTFPNFFGTSAAAPHAAAIAALVLQAKGGPGSVTPTQMRTILQRSAFPHVLDPNLATRTAQAGSSRITVTARGDGSATTQTDLNTVRVSLTGPGKLASITFDLRSANPTRVPTGLLFDPRPTVGQPFALGTLIGLTPAQITPALSDPSPTFSTQFFRLSLSFAPGSFSGGESIGFGIDRDEAATGGGGGSASLLGQGVDLVTGEVKDSGAVFFGTLEDGTSFSGTLNTRIGTGFSTLDGFGFINAASAVQQPLP